MLVSELLRRTAFQTEGLQAPGQWSRADYLNALDSALRDTAILSLCTPKWLTTAITAAAGQSSLSLIAAPYGVLGVRFAVTKKIILPTSEALENGLNPSWRDTTGIPTGWIPESGNTIRLNAKVPSDTAFEVQVIDPPTVLAADGDTVDPRIPPHVLQSLHFGGAAYLLRQAGDRQDLAQADLYEAQFKKALGVTNV